MKCGYKILSEKETNSGGPHKRKAEAEKFFRQPEFFTYLKS